MLLNGRDWEIRQGDSLDLLRSMPDGCVQTVITSPPYWGLRDYGVSGQLGLETTPEEFVAKMVEVFREVRRVLRDDGTLWLNLGDSYASNPASGGKQSSKMTGGEHKRTPKTMTYVRPDNLKPKDLIGMPWRVAFALQADGWYLRSDIIWAKPNPMPESVTDRPTKAHEYLFLLSKSERYYYDCDAIREKPTLREQANPDEYQYEARRSDDLVNYGMSKKTTSGIYGTPTTHPAGRNKRTVWTIPTHPFPEAHFATFPPALVEPCILAGSSHKACLVCGAPWERVVEKETHSAPVEERTGRVGHNGAPPQQSGWFWKPPTVRGENWQPTCKCPDNDGSGRCIILDPFSGSGTTVMVALRHGRRGIGLELNPEYVAMSERRIMNDNPLFNGLAQRS
jgi:DNA modification methylase